MLQYNPLKNIFEDICGSLVIQLAYTQLATMSLVYIKFLPKIKNISYFPCQIRVDKILDLQYDGKCSDMTVHSPFEGYILSHCEGLEKSKLSE